MPKNYIPIPRPKYDLTGKRFGRLSVLGFSHRNKRSQSFWNVRCQCGKEKTIVGFSMQRGDSNSCRCLAIEQLKKRRIVHGLANTRFNITWRNMKRRCKDPKDSSYSRYGGRGITVCREWEKFVNFRDDMYSSYLEHVKVFGEKQTTIERIDSQKGYSPTNCRWATFKEQGRNTSTNRIIEYHGEKKIMKDWAQEMGISYSALTTRLYRGWSVGEAFTTPVREVNFS